MNANPIYMPIMAAVATAASAQTPQPDDRTITVTASPMTREEIWQEAEDYIRATPIAEGTRPPARVMA